MARAKKNIIENSISYLSNIQRVDKSTNIKIYNTSNISVKYKNIDLKNIKILVLSLVKNIENNIGYVDNFVSSLLKTIPQTQFSF